MTLRPKGNGKKNPFTVDKKEVGSRIKALRDAKKMTQAELSRLVGRSRPAIAQWEEGHASPDLGYINALAFYLNSTPQYLAFGISTTAQDSFRVPVMDYTTQTGKPIGEMCIDIEFHRGLHLPASATLRAYHLPRNDMVEGAARGDVVLIDESEKTLVGAGEAVLIYQKVPSVAYVNAVPGSAHTYTVSVGGQRFQVNKSLPVIGRVVAVLKALV